MNLREQLLRRHSKENTLLITRWIGHDTERFATLMRLFLEDEYRVGQRAAWVLSYVADNDPDMVRPYFADLVDCLENPSHPAITRNTLRFLATQTDIPEELQGKLLDQAFNILQDPKQAVAIQVHAMQVAANLCEMYPELGGELRLILEDGLEHASKGYTSRARKILKQL